MEVKLHQMSQPFIPLPFKETRIKHKSRKKGFPAPFRSFPRADSVRQLYRRRRNEVQVI